MFSLSVGATALCMLASLNFLGLPESSPKAMEASLLGGKQVLASQAETTAFDGNTAVVSSENAVIPLGSAFGIKLFTDGVIVASLSEIYTENGICCPASDAGIKPGDYVLTADGKTVTGNAVLANLIGTSGGGPIALTVRRGERIFETTVTPVISEGSFKTGMWVRDSAAGIGTLTFYDPQSGSFAGLGHGICDMDTSGLMSLKSGEPAPIQLCGILKGEADHPGQLRGYFSSEEALGQLLVNNETGVYGTLHEIPTGQEVEVLSREDVVCGPVQILVSLDERGPQYYEAEIERISAKNQHTKNLVVKVTDPRLLELTGGIIQGMSGSPIFQNGKLAGAVTHVFTDDPTTGYGIFAETMLEQCRQMEPEEEKPAS